MVTISTFDYHNAGARSTSMIGNAVGFLVLFVLSGMGNGSVFKLIPSIYRARSRELDTSEPDVVRAPTGFRHASVRDRDAAESGQV